jgi:segregation and condensation protein A
MDFSIQLNSFRGPLDLLLHLVRKHEVDILDIPICTITDQFLEHLSVLEQMDINDVGEFLAVASLLIEIKSQQLLPQSDEVQDDVDDPRDALVARLLEYKKFRDAAAVLEEQSHNWQQRYARQSNDLPPRRTDPAEMPIREVELWDLVSAFGLILRDTVSTQPSSIVYDETPIHVFMQRVYDRVSQESEVQFESFFEVGMHKSTLIGIFLAILELVRHYRLGVKQTDLFGGFSILPPPEGATPLDISGADDYQSSKAA